ncbi:MAG: hypothetical protein NTX50_29010 [Candidatus Sumerlaeota bacterium]|nr:hypothetical protein [Candidatus Sumerlaeota bacterium]
MKTIEIADATDSLANYAEHAEDFPLVVTEHGRPIAALLDLHNADLETATLSANPKFIALIERSRERQSKEGGLSSQEMRMKLGIKHN